MSTIPDQLYDRLANACITYEDGAALIVLLEQIGATIHIGDQATDHVGLTPDRQDSWRLGTWSAVADQYRDLVGGAR